MGSALVFGTATAQSVVKGTVRQGGHPLPRVEVGIAARNLRIQTDTTGSYSLALGEGGIIELSVRAVGYYPQTRRLMLASGDTVTVSFELERAPQQLDSITVSAPGPTPVSGKMQAFEERRRLGFGRFFTREMLAAREHSTLGNVLRMTAGLRFVRRPDSCGGGFVVASAREGSVGWKPWMQCGTDVLPPACYTGIWLDGVRLWVPGTSDPPNVDEFQVISLEGVEVYRGPSEVPTQYQGTGSSCGALLLWTRTGDKE
jgi:hypothetical protein